MYPNAKTNKNGLSRNIPADIMRKIRQSDGYGCIFCGSILVDYEHIDPLFCEATEHHPDKIALLCSFHHDKVTRRVLPKRLVKEAKKNPFCKSNKYSHSTYYPSIEDVKLKVGNSIFEDTPIILILHGKPLIWVEKECNESPIQFNSIFYDSTGKKVGFLKKNTFYGLVTDSDIRGVSNRIEIKFKKGSIDLILKIEADGIVEIVRMNANYLGTNISVDSNGILTLKNGKSNITFDKITAKKCGTVFEFGGIPRRPAKLNLLFSEVIRTKVPIIINLEFEEKGFVYNNLIIDSNNYIVGFIFNNKVYSVIGDYIGELYKYYCNKFIINFSFDEEVFEPIYITPYNQFLNKLLPSKVFDLSYRIFE
ncbi:hypothetical protein [Acinetobacter sp. Ag2]|uniref:hypothetical protein n=1 Tax=Acinetobacter sp. Ag2 TaxID=1646532 RepID=UPI0006997097|nr:hypothetical protein [Acinetobacter sp. Ag2]